MPSITIRGVPVEFPFEPYKIQKDYMEKVIECLQNETTAILESPTGTGKTLSLLCSSLAWLQLRKAQVEAISLEMYSEESDFLQQINKNINQGVGEVTHGMLGLPSIIYASRTHSQISQAMQELKRSAYRHVKAVVIGSRDQLCIHPEVIKEESRDIKINMCLLKKKTRSCNFYNRVDHMLRDRAILESDVVDIEDLLKLGEKHKFCPYYMSGNLKKTADIIFMPYNYLLDPQIRKGLDLNLQGSIIILDEAHNVERICEDVASLQIKSTDITLCIEEVTTVMKAMTEDSVVFNETNAPTDFTPDELCVLKQMFLDFEKALDEIQLKNGPEGTTFDGTFLFDLLGKANISVSNFNNVISLIGKITLFLAAIQEGPLGRKGIGLKKFEDMLSIVFLDTSPEYKNRVNKCYKVHIETEDIKKRNSNSSWFDKKTTSSKSSCRVLNYWCFSPGFGMDMLMSQGVRSVVLTSGTLAPLKPLITELRVDVKIKLENPHIVGNDQLCVRVLTSGPDSEKLNSSYQNRDNPKYVSSLGGTILNLSRIIPDGLLIFFPSYPVLQKCQNQWQEEGIWAEINKIKPIYVEPRQKTTFNNVMNDYYSKIKDANSRGAIFIGVCRGKISEGLDFADINGRAVLIVGLPFPPLKDPRVILKKRYLDICNATDKEFLRGNEWYSLEAVRAVNQAMGRIIRHQNDYGAIILLDERFRDSRIQSQLSLWLRNHLQTVNKFGEMFGDLRRFFIHAKKMFPVSSEKNSRLQYDESSNCNRWIGDKTGKFDFSTSTACSFNKASSSSMGMVTIHKKVSSDPILNNPPKRKKIVLVPSVQDDSENKTEADYKDYITLAKTHLKFQEFKDFLDALSNYSNRLDINELTQELDKIFLNNYKNRFLLQGLLQFVKKKDKQAYGDYWEKMK